MEQVKSKSMFILGFFIFIGLLSLGYFINVSVTKYKEYERTVTVKGLSQKEFKADTVLWPIKFVIAGNDLKKLNGDVEKSTQRILSFLKSQNISKDEITVQAPNIIDKLANEYGNQNMKYRYIANQMINVYSLNVDKVRAAIGNIASLSKEGILFKASQYENRVEYLFTKLNEIKPSMIEEATTKAREVAQKFAKDSQSKLGKIKKARQGQFSISDRDRNTPYIKKVRVVSTVEYYLSD